MTRTIFLALAAAAAASPLHAETRSLSPAGLPAQENGASALSICVENAAPGDLRTCVGRVAEACGAPGAAKCVDAETAAWDAVSDDAAAALSAGRPSDTLLQSEARDDVLAHREQACAAAGQGDILKAALCRRDKAVDRAIVFHMLLSLEGGAR